MHLRFLCITYPNGEREDGLQHLPHRALGQVRLQIEVSMGLTLLTLLIHEEDGGVLLEVLGHEVLDEALLGLETGGVREIRDTLEVLERDTSNILLRHFKCNLSCPIGRFFSYLMKLI